MTSKTSAVRAGDETNPRLETMTTSSRHSRMVIVWRLLKLDLGHVELGQRVGRCVLHPDPVDRRVFRAEYRERLLHLLPPGVAERDQVALTDGLAAGECEDAHLTVGR